MSDEKRMLVRMSKTFPGCYEVYYESGGELPDELKTARFTHPDWAHRAIDDYMNSRKRGTKSGTTRSKPRTD